MAKSRYRVNALVCLLAMLLGLCLPAIAEKTPDSPAQAEVETDLNIDNLNEIINKSENYKQYLADYSGKVRPSVEVAVDLSAIQLSKGEVCLLEDFEGRPGTSLSTGEEGYVEWELEVPEEGLYNIEVIYYADEGKGSSIERSVWVNGIIPYFEARSVLFSRVWKDAEEEFRTDNRGNEIKPDMEEVKCWQTTYLMDSSGGYTEPLQFYFYKGRNTLALRASKEPMVLNGITLKQAPVQEAYTEPQSAREQAESQEPVIYIQQAEKGLLRSDVMIYPICDRSSPMMDPMSYDVKKLNAVGGTNWATVGQWAEWTVEVPQSGYYQIAFKYRQYWNNGAVSSRKVYLDGKVLYDEMNAVEFPYSGSFENKVITNADGEPMLFYLDAGDHTVRLEAVLGPVANVVAEADDAIYQLNLAYRKILMITGADPDPYRDYDIETSAPDVLDIFRNEIERMTALSEELYAFQNKKNDRSAILDQFVFQLQNLVENPDEIPSKMTAFKQNISALSTFVQESREQPLEIDYLMVYTPAAALPKADSGFFGKLAHEVRSFISSFMSDYGSVGNVYEGGKALDVWTFSGRDQADVLKKLIDDEFSLQYQANVNLQVVQATVLLPAVVAGKGPDIALNNAIGEPMNYALRNAVVDVSQFAGWDEVAARFNESALLPARFEGKVYGVPETETFYMLFYRSDILTDLGLEVPKTWQDVTDMLPVLKRNGMDFGLFPYLSTYCMFLYQNGGELYSADGRRCLLDSKVALDEFRDWTQYYIDYKLPIDFDFNNRFRSGEIPVGVSDYSTFNFLTVFAPELKGLWDFTSVPGTPDEEGNILTASPNNATYGMVLSGCEDPELAFHFLDWWTSTDVQTRFGLEMESILGPSARYTTANQEAMARLPWSNENYRSLSAQWETVFGIPQVPGGYFTSRHVENAFREVVNSTVDYRETMLEYVRTINQEITNKRQQYNLLADGGESR